MHSVSIRRIAMEGFQAFYDRVEVNLPATGMLLLRGINEETGGSSGAGKTTVARAVAYVLGYCSASVDKLRSREGKEMSVSLELDVNGVEVLIERSPGKLAARIGDEVLAGHISAIEDRLATFLGADPASRGNLQHRRQQERGTFLFLGDAEAREMLAGPMGIIALEQVVSAAGHTLKDLEKEAAVAREELAREEGALAIIPVGDLVAAEQEAGRTRGVMTVEMTAKASLEEALSSLECETKTRNEEAVVPLRVDLDRVLTRQQELSRLSPAPPADLMEAVAMADKLLAEVDRREAVARASDEERRRKVRRERGAVVGVYNRDCADRIEGGRLAAEADTLQTEVDLLRQKMCSLCRRPWEEALERAGAKTKRIEELRLKAKDLKDVTPPDLAVWDREHPDIPDPALERFVQARMVASKSLSQARDAVAAATRGVMAEWQRETETLTREADVLKEKVAAIAMQVDPGVKKLRLQVEEAKEKVRVAHEHRRSAEETLSNVGKVRERHAVQERRTEEARVKVRGVAERAAKERDLEATLRAFGGAFMEDVLREVGDEASGLLAAVPNTRHLTVAFRSEKETKKGDLKQTLTAVVGVGSAELVGRSAIKEGISGGQFSVVQLAVDLAVLLVIERRTGVRWGWLFLDEAFDGLGPVEKEGAIDLLKQIELDRTIVIMDHSSETGGLFDHMITVRYKGERARIET